MVKLSKLILVVAIVAMLTVPTNLAMGYHTSTTILNPTPVSGDSFGFSVSISGNRVLVGAYSDDTGASGAGSAYLYDATTGALLRTFNNPTPALNDVFGYSVSIDGNNVLVGAYGDDTGAENAGSVYLFDATTGTLLRTFNNPTPIQNDSFGLSISISGNKVLVGEPLDDNGGQNVGRAYLFDTSGTLLRTFNNPLPSVDDHFGYSVSISGNNALIGAYRDDAGAVDAGSAHLFDATTGIWTKTFNNPAPASGDNFGSSVSISGNNVLIGTQFDDVAFTDAGAAYLFDAWSGDLLKTFNNPAPASGDNFGSSVSISGNNALIGAPLDDAGAVDSGTAYFFDATTGTLLRTLNNPSNASGDGFGESVSISGNQSVVGTRYDDTVTTDAGSAYLFFDIPSEYELAQGQIQILGTCGLSFPNGNQVNYGPLLPNTISPEIKLNMTNSGSISAALTVKGGDWKDSGNNSVMLGNRTHYNVTSGTYLQKTPLQSFDQSIVGNFIPASILQTFWQLQAILLNPSFTGTATQTMNFTVSC